MVQRVFRTEVDIQCAGVTGLLIAQGLKQVRPPKVSSPILIRNYVNRLA